MTVDVPHSDRRRPGTFQLRELPYYGFWAFAHESRTDYSMIMGALFLFLTGGGAYSLDARREQ
jgi:putative oxidoreductase